MDFGCCEPQNFSMSFHDEVEVSTEGAFEILFKADVFARQCSEQAAEFSCRCFRERFEDFFFGFEIIVERAARQIRAADDVPHSRRLIAEFCENETRSIQYCFTVSSFGALSFALGL